jgi:hypothetical protein
LTPYLRGDNLLNIFMGNKLLIIISMFILMGCNPRGNNKRGNVDSQVTKKSDNKVSKKPDTLTVDTTGLLIDCKVLFRKSYIGGLQGTSSTKDSTGYMCFMDCYVCPNTYEIVFAYKEGVKSRKALGYEGLGKYFDAGCDNSFANFDCFAFVLPLVDPEKQKDMHALNMSFPIKVKIYKRIMADNWHLINEVNVNSFEEYGSLQFKTIYGF